MGVVMVQLVADVDADVVPVARVEGVVVDLVVAAADAAAVVVVVVVALVGNLNQELSQIQTLEFLVFVVHLMEDYEHVLNECDQFRWEDYYQRDHLLDIDQYCYYDQNASR
jgi:hypothetical protein